MTVLPSWWADGVRVVAHDGQAGVLVHVRGGGADSWLVHLDGGDYATPPAPEDWRPEIRQLLTTGQRNRVVHDAERALLRAFGCSYVPEWDALPESVRQHDPRPRAVGRPELDGLQNLVRGAVAAALAPYTREAL